MPDSPADASVEDRRATVHERARAAADEMATTLFRTAFSHDVVEVHDMSTGLYDDRGNLLGQTWLGATGHVGVMPVVGKELVRKFPPESVRPGDIFISNDPWVCNGQTADIFIFTPAFHRDRGPEAGSPKDRDHLPIRPRPK